MYRIVEQDGSDESVQMQRVNAASIPKVWMKVKTQTEISSPAGYASMYLYMKVNTKKVVAEMPPHLLLPECASYKNGL